jgi:hypothetical protein
MLGLLICSVISILCAIYGVFKFNGEYTCWVVKWNKTLKKSCQNVFWIPSACVVAAVLGMAVMRTADWP